MMRIAKAFTQWVIRTRRAWIFTSVATLHLLSSVGCGLVGGRGRTLHAPYLPRISTVCVPCWARQRYSLSDDPMLTDYSARAVGRRDRRLRRNALDQTGRGRGGGLARS